MMESASPRMLLDKVKRKLARSIHKRAARLFWMPFPPGGSLGREAVARMYLRGRGIEIGALHHPLRVPRSAHVQYVDRMTRLELRRHYPELRSEKLSAVDLIDDGEELGTIRDATQDFVIANHFVEHCENPIGAIGNMLRVLKAGGILFLAIPDKRYTFDKDRPVTTVDHLLRDYHEGAAWSRRQHYEEWTRLVDKIQDDAEAEKAVDRLMADRYAIHYHVWTQPDMLEFLLTLRTMWSFEVELILKRKNEVIFILRKKVPAAIPQAAEP